MRTIYRGSALALTLIATQPAFAEDDADGQGTIIVSSARAANDAERQVAETPGGADVVNHQDYADKSLVSLRDALAFTPGVYMQPRYGQEIRISIRGSGISRGFHMRGLTLLQDGVPINLADDNGDFQELDPSFFDHLEIYRGANALRFGSGTLGGAVNGITPTGRDAAGFYLRGDGGTFETLRGLVSYGGATGTADYWAALSADTSDGDRQHAKRDSLRFHGNVGVKLSEVADTRFYVSANTIDQQLPGALNLNTALTAPETGNFIGDQARDIDSLRLQNRTTLDLGEGSLTLAAFYNRKSLYHPIYQVIDQDSQDYGGSFRYDWDSGPWSLTAGGETRFGTVASERYVNISGERGALTFAADQKARTSNLFAEVRYRPIDTLSLIVGGIYVDGFRRQHQTFAGTVTDVTGRAGFTEFSPKFGVLYDAAPDIQVYANYSRSAELPGFIELAQISAFVPIEAQTAWTAEIGTRGRAGIAGWDVSLYRAAIDGELLQFTVGPDIPASTFNADETRHQGIEAALTLDFNEWLRLRQTYLYSDFRFVGDAQFGDNRLPVVPEHAYRAELRIGSERLHVAPNLEWLPEGAWADYRNALKVDGYVLVGLTAGYSVADNIDLFLDARNLFDEEAVGDISAAIAATPASVIFYPIERRAVFGGVRARF